MLLQSTPAQLLSTPGTLARLGDRSARSAIGDPEMAGGLDCCRTVLQTAGGPDPGTDQERETAPLERLDPDEAGTRD